jgi:hypothetical protein
MISGVLILLSLVTGSTRTLNPGWISAVKVMDFEYNQL